MANLKKSFYFTFLVSELLGLSFILQQHDIVFLVSSDQDFCPAPYICYAYKFQLYSYMYELFM